MIILEGPDGSGKSTLSTHLQLALGLKQHDRTSTSEGGPVDRLYEWAWHDVNSWDEFRDPMIYDRHPLISEYIYGPVIRQALPPGFNDTAAFPMRKAFQKEALVVLCLPPLETVLTAIHKEAQMPGVFENIRTIYCLYEGLIKFWDGQLITYDFTRESGKGSLDSVVRASRLHIAEWNRNHV